MSEAEMSFIFYFLFFSCPACFSKLCRVYIAKGGIHGLDMSLFIITPTCL